MNISGKQTTTQKFYYIYILTKIKFMNITLDQAERAIQAAKAKASEINTLMNIAVVDSGTNLIAFVHMDGAWLGSIDISQKKARTARYFNMDTGEIGKLSQPGGPLYNIEHSNNGLITFPGGVCISDAEGNIIGAIGVSGSTVENDHAVAIAGAAAAI
jgi:uncharacterized protein GlcG (DUF336 family)